MNLSIFQEILTPFLTVSLISTKINLFVHWYFQRQFGFCWRQSQKKSIFPPRNHYFGVFHIDHHPMHYSITKKHTLSLHVKNIDIKNYAINSATAVVEISTGFKLSALFRAQQYSPRVFQHPSDLAHLWQTLQWCGKQSQSALSSEAQSTSSSCHPRLRPRRQTRPGLCFSERLWFREGEKYHCQPIYATRSTFRIACNFRNKNTISRSQTQFFEVGGRQKRAFSMNESTMRYHGIDFFLWDSSRYQHVTWAAGATARDYLESQPQLFRTDSISY